MLSENGSTGNYPLTLPTQPTRLLGRKSELEAIRQQLLGRDVRLLTLAGPAGVGKTRLAVEAGAVVAAQFPHGATLVDLAPVRDPSRVLQVIAQNMGLPDPGSLGLMSRLQTYLQSRTILLILDSFDHVQPAASEIATLLSTCSGITLLVTSREPLHLLWEHTFRVAPLPVPDLKRLPPLNELVQIPSVALFLERALRITPGFALTNENTLAVAELCVRLDGLPLAIELAAASVSLLSPQMILERMGQRLSLLRWDAQDLPERQHTLRSAIGWSYDLLSVDERTLFRQLGVFVNGFDLESAGALVACHPECAIDVLAGLASLVEKSLIQVEGQSEERVRYTLLESMREYACERLAQMEELEIAERAHAVYFLKLAERADAELRSHNQRAWYLRLEHEHDNLRAAMQWLLDHGDREEALRLATALGFFWVVRRYHAEGWRWLEETTRLALEADPALRITALLRSGLLLAFRGDYQKSKLLLEEAQVVARKLQDSQATAQSLIYQGMCSALAGSWPEGVRLIKAGMDYWEAHTDQQEIGFVLRYLSVASFMQQDYEEAAAFYEAAADRLNAIGDVRTAALVLPYLALTKWKLGDVSRAVRILQDCIRFTVTFQDRQLLSLAVDASLRLIGDQVLPEMRARLSGARHALNQATGVAQGIWEQWSAHSDTRLIEQLEQEGLLGVAYREGWSLSFGEVVDVTLGLLEDFLQPLTRPKMVQNFQPEKSILSAREREVLQLVADGLPNKVIARRLSISPSTVSYHLVSVFSKLGAANRPQAVALASHRGLL